MALSPDRTLVDVRSRADWRAWLEANHASSEGAWAITFKKASVPDGAEYVSSRDLNEECLCFGWIDSKPGKVDDERTALLCSPRKPGSGWSKVNKERLEPLLTAGLVAPAGLAAIDAAKADGSWTKLDDVDALAVPDDLAAAFDGFASARSNFDAFPPSARRGILEWIGQAKRPETRAKRIAETARLADENVRANQWPRR